MSLRSGSLWRLCSCQINVAQAAGLIPLAVWVCCGLPERVSIGSRIRSRRAKGETHAVISGVLSNADDMQVELPNGNAVAMGG